MSLVSLQSVLYPLILFDLCLVLCAVDILAPDRIGGLKGLTEFG